MSNELDKIKNASIEAKDLMFNHGKPVVSTEPVEISSRKYVDNKIDDLEQKLGIKDSSVVDILRDFLEVFNINSEEELLSVYKEATKVKDQIDFFKEFQELLSKHKAALNIEVRSDDHDTKCIGFEFTSPYWNSHRFIHEFSTKMEFTPIDCDEVITQLNILKHT